MELPDWVQELNAARAAHQARREAMMGRVHTDPVAYALVNIIERVVETAIANPNRSMHDDRAGVLDAATAVWSLMGGAGSITAYEVRVPPKVLRETLCLAQSLFANGQPFVSNPGSHIATLQLVINECDRHRPVGVDGKHGDRHTKTCGCEDR